MTATRPAGWWRPVPAAVATSERAPAATTSPPAGAVAFGALLAFTAILLAAPQQYFPLLRPWRIALLAGLVAMGAQVLGAVLHRRPLRLGGPEMGLVWGIVAWAAATVPLSYWPGGSLSFLGNIYLKTVAIFWMIIATVNTPARLRAMALTLSLLSVPIALTGIHNFQSGVFLAMAAGRIVGYEAPLTENPNDLALMLNLILPLTFGLAVAGRSAAARVFLLAIVVLNVAAVVVTFSRAGFLTLLTIFAATLWRLMRNGRLPVAVAAVVLTLVALPLAPEGYRMRIGTIADPQSDTTGSAQARWADTLTGVRLVVANPVVGAGMGMNTLALNQARGPTWMPVHNVYLEYGVDLGLPGLVLFLLLFRRCVRDLRAARARLRQEPSRQDLLPVLDGIETGLVAFAVAAFFYPVGYLFYFYYLGGLAVAAHRIYAAPEASR